MVLKAVASPFIFRVHLACFTSPTDTPYIHNSEGAVPKKEDGESKRTLEKYTSNAGKAKRKIIRKAVGSAQKTANKKSNTTLSDPTQSQVATRRKVENQFACGYVHFSLVINRLRLKQIQDVLKKRF